ncbi:hypothetical protein CGLO_13924 [Colletotrichum gloeosporioides Cg-14]|uniref:Capsule synthesis protein CapA domain-containing protein n=1 Tax=Colletotrichum gloeosporioides (strain Cg-14) TaxID=1237896 RepID=T0L611_COLGC|nr:hypothetical protein CGLO_13924 [Colletotrichum gloeosporioides Cg-14]
MSKAGADIIIGAHPHVLEPMEAGQEHVILHLFSII